MSRSSRAVGYCESVECRDYLKGVFLLEHGDTFWCPQCRSVGFIERETTKVEGDSDVFGQVIVEFNYDPCQKRYCELAIVEDENMSLESSTMRVKSPLVRTEKRALKIAESVLANLAMGATVSEGLRIKEIVLSFDDSLDKLKNDLKVVESRWLNSPFYKKVVSTSSGPEFKKREKE